MKRRALAGFLVAFLASVLGSKAQTRPHIAYVYPAGGQQGSTFETIIAGRALFGPTNIYFSGPGITAKILEYSRPMSGKELAEARDQARKLQEKKTTIERNARRRQPATDSSTNLVWTAEDEKLLAALRAKISKANRPLNPELAEPVTVEVTIDDAAPPGRCEVRLQTGAGLSNPLFFYVGQLPEITEEANAPDNRARYGRTSTNRPMNSSAENEMNVTIPATLNGQIMPGGRDRYRFSAKKDQKLVAAVQARALIPYLANAVPGWFQAVLTLYDANGREITRQDDFRFDPDPVIYFEIPKDGEYIAEIRDSIYRGREDFTYRLSIAESPFIANAYPLGGAVGETLLLTLTGWNLPTNRISTRLLEGHVPSICVTNGQFVSNQLPLAVCDLPETQENEPNDSPGATAETTLPVIINGRIDRPGDADVFRIDGHAGQIVVAEVHARRLNSPLDSLLKLTDAAGKELASNDDHVDKGAGLTSHHADSYLRASFPHGGTFYLHLTDTQNKGGPEYGYRLRVSPPQPDFELRVVPSSLEVRGAMSVPITVYALRKDGFTNEINLALKDPPNGFALSGARIPANAEKAQFTLSGPGKRLAQPVQLQIAGRAEINGREITRPALPAEDLMQAFAYRHLVPAEEMLVLAMGSPFALNGPVRPLNEAAVKLPLGGAARAEFRLPARANSARLDFELSDPPEGISLQRSTFTEDRLELLVRAESDKVKQFEGNLIVNVFAIRQDSGATNRPPVQRRALVGALPAIPFQIVRDTAVSQAPATGAQAP